ncbi:uncharacterized protein G2W53_000066 [Senna tora]|uniref:Uncharacterized protein n=1 Tax=Senna tora TaxID=362788 RepID=A0A835CHD2_9FABA|nr:uncharacterized protein G2W53_000066 [Senna tora]
MSVHAPQRTVRSVDQSGRSTTPKNHGVDL